QKNAELAQGLMKIGDTEMDTSVYYTFKNTNSGLVMDIAGGEMADGTNVQQWGSNGLTCQQWQLKPFANGTTYYYVHSVADPNYVLKAMTGSDGGNIQIVPYSSKDSMMLFKFTKIGDGSYYISTRSSKDACFVEVANASGSSGANVQQWSWTYSKCQNWQAEKIAIQTEPVVTTTTTTKTEPAVKLALGDIDGSNRINVLDLSLVKKLVNSSAGFTPEQIKAADVNGDGTVNASDAKLMQEYISGKDVEFSEPAFDYDQHYYAIEAVGVDGWNESSNAGFEGAGYWNFNNAVGSNLTWTVQAPSEGNYAVNFRYANGTTALRTLKITVNGGTETWYLDFPGTGAWTTWADTSIVLPLNAGTNTIKVESATADGGPNMDYLTIAEYDASKLTSDGNYYAVDQVWEDGVAETSNAGYTKDEGYVNLANNDTSNITFTVNVDETANYMTHIRFANGSTIDRQMKVYVNNNTNAFWLQSFTGTGAWTTWTEFGLVLPLNKGVNTIKFVSAVADA
ncbi:MAG: RICIN domain-containing protein, partial [Oscillospiraceae bacterium]|nr:RICIN domain-containing protein [Oscillospiraceae bacterium]